MMEVSKLTVDCIIVTYNKVNFLKECLKQVLKQTFPIDRIIVVDNNSNDKTKKFLDDISNKKKKIIPIFLGKNIGGAGGFYTGIKYCIRHHPSDFFWLMDDDTVPEIEALKFLVEKSYTNTGFCASNVRWIDGSAALMNVPGFSRDANNTSFCDALKIKNASFVSLLVNRKAVLEVGLPIKDFFIWGDDVEFTLRITDAGYVNYLCLKSLVTHKMRENEEVNIFNENGNVARINRYFFEYRNSVFRLKRQGIKYLLKDIIKRVILILKIIFGKTDFKLRKILIILKGSFAGFFFNPKIEKIKL